MKWKTYIISHKKSPENSGLFVYYLLLSKLSFYLLLLHSLKPLLQYKPI